jgi:hypothetical protein
MRHSTIPVFFVRASINRFVWLSELDWLTDTEMSKLRCSEDFDVLEASEKMPSSFLLKISNFAEA